MLTLDVPILVIGTGASARIRAEVDYIFTAGLRDDQVQIIGIANLADFG
jgi:hypothetical protein